MNDVAPPRGPLDLNLLRTFLAVYRAGSFTTAAARLGLSQPTVTAQIRALEQQTTRPLFTRLPRGTEPTAFAHELAARVTLPLDALAGVGDADRLESRPSPVHLAGPSELLCTRVLPALAPLVAGGVGLRVAQGQTEHLVEQLRAGQQDLVIATRRPRGRSLESVALADEEYLLVAAPTWAGALAGRDPGTGLSSLLREVPLVSYAEDMPIVRRYWRTVFGKQIPPGGAAMTVPNLHAVVAALVAGAGYSVLPRSICQEHLDAGRLLVLDDPAEPPLNTLFLVQRPGSEANPDVARVREVLREAARSW
nr:LysR family transcriptional regulator [Kineosporia corallincola]